MKELLAGLLAGLDVADPDPSFSVSLQPPMIAWRILVIRKSSCGERTVRAIPPKEPNTGAGIRIVGDDLLVPAYPVARDSGPSVVEASGWNFDHELLDVVEEVVVRIDVEDRRSDWADALPLGHCREERIHLRFRQVVYDGIGTDPGTGGDFGAVAAVGFLGPV